MDTACLWIGRIVVGCGALAATAALCAIILNFVYVRFMDHAVFMVVLKKDFIVAIDQDGNEALYVDGALVPTEGNTVFATDIAIAAGERPIRFSHVSVLHDALIDWPDRFDELEKETEETGV